MHVADGIRCFKGWCEAHGCLLRPDPDGGPPGHRGHAQGRDALVQLLRARLLRAGKTAQRQVRIPGDLEAALASSADRRKGDAVFPADISSAADKTTPESLWNIKTLPLF